MMCIMDHLILCLQEAIRQLEQLVELEKECYGDISVEVGMIMLPLSSIVCDHVTNRLVNHTSC